MIVIKNCWSREFFTFRQSSLVTEMGVKGGNDTKNPKLEIKD